MTLPGTSKAGSESATNTSDVLSDTPMTRSAKDSGGDAFPGVIDSTSDIGRGSNDDPDSTRNGSFSVDFGDNFGDDDDELPVGGANEHEFGFRATSQEYDELGVDLSPWAPLLAMLDSTEPEASPDDRPFTPGEGVEGAHALELRAESMLQYAERGAQRTGVLDRTEVGVSDDNRDVVAGRDEVEIDGMLEEHTGHGLVHVADDVEMNVGGPLRMHAHLEDNIIMAGVMTDEWSGGTFITAAMSDDMAAGLGLRCTAPLDLWVHGLIGMEERPGTCAADGLLLELAGTLYEREYGPSAHAALVARHSGTVVTTMKTGFRPLMKTAIGVRNLIPGGGGGGGDASASPPAAPPASGGGGGGETAGAATLTAVESGGALGRGAAGSDDTDEIVSVVRTVESASDTAEVENLQHPASTADNLDDLARVEVEGAGYQQVAEIYEQPIPLAPEQATAEPSPGAGSTAAGSGGKQPPPLDHTAPGAEGYDFRSAYGSLHDRNQFYRQELNLRGNLYLREYLGEIDKKAIELFEALGGSVDDIAIDNYGLRTSNVYATLETMANEVEMAGDVERLADIRAAMEQLEALVQSTLADVAAHTDDFSGVAIGSQRGPIDPNIDVDKLRSWLEDQKLAAQQAMMDPETPFEDFQRLSWTQDYYDQMLKALDAGINPLAESSDQVAFINAGKIEPYKAQFADEIAAAEEAGDWVLIPPRAPDQDQLDLFRELHDGLMETLSDPEFFRSAEEMGGDTFTGAVHSPMDPGPDLPGPDSTRPPPGGVDEPDVNPVLGADVPPPTPPLDLTRPGTEGYDFWKSYGSLHNRNQFYREEFNFRGNFFMREYLREIDTKAMKLFQGLDGPADAIDGDNFGYRTSSIYRTLEQMAQDAQAANDLNRAADIRTAMDEIEGIVNSTLAEVALRTDEFSGAAPWSPRAPIDPNIDTGKLRSWLQDQSQQAHERLLAAQTDEAQQLAGWEWGYYVQLIQSLDEGVNPLAVSNEQIAVMSINTGKPIPTQVADEVAGTAAEGHELVSPRPQPGDEAYLYASLQELLIATLSDPEFHRSAEEMGAGAFTFPVRARIDEGLDFLGPDSLRPLGGGDVPPPRSPRSAAAVPLPTVPRLRPSTSGRAGGSSSRPRSPAAPRGPRTTPPRGQPTSRGSRGFRCRTTPRSMLAMWTPGISSVRRPSPRTWTWRASTTCSTPRPRTTAAPPARRPPAPSPRGARMRTRPARSPGRTIPPPPPAAETGPCQALRASLRASPRARPIRCPPAPPRARRLPTLRRPAPRRPMRSRAPPVLARTSTTNPCPSKDARSRGRPFPTIRRNSPNRSTVRRFRSRTSLASSPVRPDQAENPFSSTPTTCPLPASPTPTRTRRSPIGASSTQGTPGAGPTGTRTPCGEEPAAARRRWTRPTPAGPSSPRQSTPRQRPSATTRAGSCTSSSTRPRCTRRRGRRLPTCTAAPIPRTRSTAPTRRITSLGPGAGSRHTRPDSADSRRDGTNFRSRTANGS